MITRLLNFFPPHEEALLAAVDVIHAGGLVAFPTETVYGLGADALNPSAVRRIFAAKGRPSTNPLIVHIADVSQVKRVAADWPEAAVLLAAKFWPGPLTIVVPKHERVPEAVTAGGPTVAVRCPSSPFARALLAAVGVPLAAPSANRSGELSPTTARHVMKSLANEVEIVLDGGPCGGGIESTVIDVSRFPYRLLRPGLVSLEALERILGPIESSGSVAAGEVLSSPGMLARHYAPRTPLELFPTEADLWRRLTELDGTRAFVLKLPDSPERVSTMLYHELHRLDDHGYDRVLVVLPPDAPEWLAVRDRLLRAATPDEPNA